MIVNVVYGFLGSGKTTFIRHVLENPIQEEKTIILVNEFGEVGLDGAILAGENSQVAEVVEMPSGCICCTMAHDFRTQFLDLHERFAPDRMIVEPTGVATISQIMQILNGEDLEPLYDAVHLIHILDSTEFLSFIKRQRHYIENQIRASRRVILNKVDRIDPQMIELLVSSVKEINPEAEVLAASFAKLGDATLRRLLGKTAEQEEEHEHAHEHDHAHDEEHEHAHEHDHAHDEDHEHDHDHDDDHFEFESVGRKSAAVFDRQRLVSFFEELKDGRYGNVVRAKGIFRTPKNWIKLELASKEVQVEPIAPSKESIVSIIGEEVRAEEVDVALNRCQI